MKPLVFLRENLRLFNLKLDAIYALQGKKKLDVLAISLSSFKIRKINQRNEIFT